MVLLENSSIKHGFGTRRLKLDYVRFLASVISLFHLVKTMVILTYRHPKNNSCILQRVSSDLQTTKRIFTGYISKHIQMSQ